MNQQERRPLLLVVLAIPLRFQNPSLNLLLRTIKVEFLSSAQGFTLQFFLSKPRELANHERLGVEILSVVVPGIV